MPLVRMRPTEKTRLTASVTIDKKRPKPVTAVGVSRSQQRAQVGSRNEIKPVSAAGAAQIASATGMGLTT